MAKISIVFPTYQAGSLIGTTLDTVLNSFNEKIKIGEIEIIVVNDGSTDNTEEVLKKYSDSIVVLKNEKNMGKGFSVRRAYLYSLSDYILFTDADLPYGIDSVKGLIEKLENGCICIIGERNDMDGNWFRKLTHWGFLMCERIILGINFKDTQCGIKGFRTDIIQELSRIAISNRFASEAELMFLLKNAKIRIDTLAVPSANYGKTTIKIKDIITMLWDLMRIRLHRYNLKNLKH